MLLRATQIHSLIIDSIKCVNKLREILYIYSEIRLKRIFLLKDLSSTVSSLEEMRYVVDELFAIFNVNSVCNYCVFL